MEGDVKSLIIFLVALFLVATLAVPTATAGCYNVAVKWDGGSWSGLHCFDWEACTVSVRTLDGTSVHLAKLEVQECVRQKRFEYKGYFDHNPKDPGYWSEADCSFNATNVACVWEDKNGVSGTTTGTLGGVGFKPPSGRGKPGNRIGAGVR